MITLDADHHASQPRTSRVWIFVYCVVLCGVGVYASLSLARLKTSWSDALCGPWGCTPPLEALLACHAAWLFVLALLVVASAIRSRRLLCRAGWLLAALGFGGAVVFALVELRRMGWQLDTRYLLHRIGLDIISATDVPILPALILGLPLLIVMAVFGKREVAADASSTTS